MIVRAKMSWACVLGFAGMAGLTGALPAVENPSPDANPYTVITVRNVFHLTDPPPPPPPSDANKLADLPKVMLTGFVGKGNSMKVLLAIPPPKDSKETIYYTSLLPGQKDHDVELVAIHLDKEAVDIMNSGTSQTLTVKSNSYLSSASAPAPGKGGPPGMPAGIGLRRQPPGFPQPGMPPPGAPSAATTPSGGGSAVIAGGGSGSGIVAGGGGGSGSSSSGAYVSGGAGYSSSGTTASANNNAGSQIANTLFNPTTGHYQMPTPTAPAIPPEAQSAAMVIQKAQAAAKGMSFPPLPPAVQAEVDAAEGASSQ